VRPQEHKRGRDDVRPLFLRQAGIPLTRPRIVFWSYLIDARKALTLPEIIEAMRERGIGRATAYRCVKLFTDLGVLRSFRDITGETCHVLVHVGDGHVLVCGRCHAVVELPAGREVVRMIRHAQAVSGFEVYGSELMLYGLCSDCRLALS